MEKKVTFEKMLEEYGRPVFRYIYSHIHHLENSEDLTQQTFIKLWEQKEKVETLEFPTKYLYKIALNEIRMYVRDNPSLVTLPDGVEIADPRSLNGEEMANISLIMEEIVKLTSLEREVITLHYLKQMSIKETSFAVGKPITATRVALFRALKKLKTNIQKTNLEEKNEK